MPFAEQAVLVLGLALFLAPDGEHAVSQLNGEIFLVETGYFGRNPHFLIGFADLEVRPSCRAIEEAVGAERGNIETAKEVIEQPIHLAVEREERADFFATPYAHVAAAIPRNQISHGHGHVLL